MNGRQVKVKDDTSDYVIYYPCPCSQLPPVGQDIPDEGCQTVSIDPGIKNFAIRIEKRYRNLYVETVHMSKYDFSSYGDVSESTGTTKIDPVIITAATCILNDLLPIMQDSRIIGIERQMAINYKSSRIFQHVMTYFMMVVTTFKYPCVIMDISPKLKGKILGAPKGLKYNELKYWSIQMGIQYSTWRNDQVALEVIKGYQKKGKLAAADITDTLIQMEAWFILVGGVRTFPPGYFTKPAIKIEIIQ